MEKHCVSLEIAKKLKEAGWKKETFFILGKVEYGKPKKSYFELISRDNDEQRPIITEEYPAPLATEILEELPYTFEKYELLIKPINFNQWGIYYTDDDNKLKPCLYGTSELTLPNALAKMWLYLTSKGEL